MCFTNHANYQGYMLRWRKGKISLSEVLDVGLVGLCEGLKGKGGSDENGELQLELKSSARPGER